nr:MAG TPA: hypothetical protein [Caudoviricetes sp.]
MRAKSRLKIQICETLNFRKMLIFKGFFDEFLVFRPGSSLEFRSFYSHMQVV